MAFAHRGGAKRWPENTLEAFQGAIRLGFRHIETDVHMTRDGEIVCIHDDTVDRTTDGRGLVREMTLSELRALDAGYRFTTDGETFPYRDRGLKVPTLEEAFELHPESRFNVEIKERSPSLISAVLSFIERRALHERILVAAADDRIGNAFRRAARLRVVTSPGRHWIFRFWLGVRTGLHRFERYPFQALQVPPTHGVLTVVDRPFIEAAHEHGIEVHVWTIDDPAEMRRLIDLGVDGLMTDEPEILLATLGRHPKDATERP